MRDVDEASDVEIGHVMHDLLVGCRIRGRQTSVIGSEKKLPNSFSSTVILRSEDSTQAPAAGDSFFNADLCGSCAFLGDSFCLLKCCGFWLRVLWAIRKMIETGNQKQKTDAASFHRLKSPSGRQQSAFINSTRTSGSQRSFGQRVPEYHCRLYGCRKGGPFEQTSERAVTNLSIQHSCGISRGGQCARICTGEAVGRPGRVQTDSNVLEAQKFAPPSRQARRTHHQSYGRRFARRGR